MKLKYFPAIALSLSPLLVAVPASSQSCFIDLGDGAIDLGSLCPSAAPVAPATTEKPKRDSSLDSIFSRKILDEEKMFDLAGGSAIRYADLYCGERISGLSHHRADSYARKIVDEQMLNILLTYENGTDFYDIAGGYLIQEYDNRVNDKCPEYS